MGGKEIKEEGGKEEKRRGGGEGGRERTSGFMGLLCSINGRSIKQYFFFDRAWPIITHTECTWMVVYEKGELKIIEEKIKKKN